jgi:hypothetical protein
MQSSLKRRLSAAEARAPKQELDKDIEDLLKWASPDELESLEAILECVMGQNTQPDDENKMAEIIEAIEQRRKRTGC